MLYPEAIIEEVRVSNDIIDVVSEYVTLKRAGAYYKGLCPFHHEKTPSFTVTANKQIFHCFGCGASGNVLSFIMKIENLDFVEALKLLAEKANIHLPETEENGEYKQKNDQMEKLFKINTEAAKYFYYYLNSTKGSKGLQYIKDRNLWTDTIKKFGIGYIGNETWDELFKYLNKKGFSQEDIVKVGLAIYKEEKNLYYDRFRNRIMFPIFDIRKRVIGFGGRILEEGQPKYLNSPETVLFNKSKNLYGLYLAKNSKRDYILVVEGYMDVISLHQAGFDQAVASLGTALTLEQAKLLKKYKQEVILCYDNDEAGRSATLRGIDILSSVGMKVKVLSVEEEKDPDEFIKKNGSEEFEKLLKKAVSAVQYKINLIKQKYNLSDTIQKVSFLQEFVMMISKLPNEIEIEAYIKEVAQETDISLEAIYNEKRKIETKRDIKKPLTVNRNNIHTGIRKNFLKVKENKNNAFIDAQRQLLYIISEDYYIYNKIKNHIDIQDFGEGTFREIAQKIFLKLDKGEKIVVADFIAHFEDIQTQELVAFIFQLNEEYEDSEKEKAVNDALKTIKLNVLLEKQKECKEKLDMQSFQKINKMINEIKQGKNYIEIYERKDHS